MKRNFLLTFSLTASILLVLFFVTLSMAYLGTPDEVSFIKVSDLPFLGVGVAYLIFIVSWAIAYSKHVMFPNKQSVLLLGILIGASGVAALSIVEADVSITALRWSELLKGVVSAYAFGLVGAAMQLYFFVFALSIPFFNRILRVLK